MHHPPSVAPPVVGDLPVDGYDDGHDDGHDDGYVRPTDFQVATSYVHGVLEATTAPQRVRAPLSALAAAIRPALEAGPTFVFFSGGRDSSAVLAMAAHVATTEGLAPPIPVTRRYPGHPGTEESEWQRLVVDHLGLREWIRLTVGDDNDLLGDGARASLRRRGLVWPPALHVLDHTLDALHEGTVLTGEGGDQTLGNRRVTPVARARHWRIGRRRAQRAAEAVLPRWPRSVVLRRRLRLHQPWLRPATLQRHLDLIIADDLTEPLSYERATTWIGRRRAWRVLAHNAARVSSDHGITMDHPLLDPGFLAALGRFGGTLGFPSRTATMEALFHGLLPAPLLRRSSKARFNTPYHGPGSRDFTRHWDRDGLDPDLVDVDRLHEEWQSEHPAPITALLMQCAWLRTQGQQAAG